MTRPHLAVAIAVIGLWIGWSRRRFQAVVPIAVPAVTAVAILILWNRWYVGSASIGGPYRGAITQAVRPWSEGLVEFGVNIAGTLVSGWSGVLLYSPVVLALAFAVPAGWRSAPDWAKGALLGGPAYLAVQLRVDTFTGGGTFVGNRLVIETLVLSAPLAIVGYDRWAIGHPWRVFWTASAAAVSIGIHAVGVGLADYRVGGGFSNWTAWYPVVMVRAAGLVGVLVVAAVLLPLVLCVRDFLRTALSTRPTENVRSPGSASARAAGRATR